MILAKNKTSLWSSVLYHKTSSRAPRRYSVPGCLQAAWTPGCAWWENVWT